MGAEQVDAVIVDYREAGLDAATVALLGWCVKLTRTPGRMRRDDVDALRGHGFSDEQVLNAALVCSYFNFINRMADGLGVDLEPEWGPHLAPLPPVPW